MSFAKVFAIAAVLCHSTLAAECGPDADACNDETSFIQVHQTLERRVVQDPVVDAMDAADTAVSVASAGVSAAASDEKLAKEQLYVQKFADQYANWNSKGANLNSDAAKVKAYKQGRRNTRAMQTARDATQAAQNEAAAWTAAAAAEANAQVLAASAEAASQQRMAAAANASALEKIAFQKMQATKTAVANTNIQSNAAQAVLDATASASAAAASNTAAAAAANATAAKAAWAAGNATAAKAAKANATAMVKQSNQAEAWSAKNSNALQNSEAKVAAYTAAAPAPSR